MISGHSRDIGHLVKLNIWNVELVPVVRDGEGKGWRVGSDGAFTCRVG